MNASPATLHLLVHQAGVRAPASDDWWDSPLETALVALSAARHPPAHREQAERALARIIRWFVDGEPRRISADTAALAVAAAAAHDLAQSDRRLAAAAIAAVDDLADRGTMIVPSTHLALCAWALDRVQPDRASAPWPALRSRADAGARGLDGALLTFTSALSADRFDAGALVRGLLSSVPVSPSLGNSAVVLWLLTAAIERTAEALGHNEPGLQALVDRRSEVTTRLAQELDRDAFDPPVVRDFDPDLDDPVAETIYISRLEALLLDLSLASSEPEEPWLRYEEAERFFGTRAQQECATRRQAERTVRVRSAQLTLGIGALAGAVVCLSLVIASVDASVIAPAAIAVFAATGVVAVLLWRGTKDDPLLVNTSLAFAVTLTVCAVLDAVNQALTDPLFADLTGLIVGILLPTVVALVVALANYSDRDNNGSRR